MIPILGLPQDHSNLIAHLLCLLVDQNRIPTQKAPPFGGAFAFCAKRVSPSAKD